MIRRILLLSILVPGLSFGQDTDPGPGFQMIMMNNPAYSGIEGDGVLRLSYLNLYPGNNYNLHSAYLSYDSYFPALHGGAGFYLSDEYMGGIINDLKGGLSYAYFLQARKNLFINVGLSASVYHRGYNFNKAVLPDQIDPLGGVTLPSMEILANSGSTLFDIGAGFLFISGNIFGGVSINHLAEPDLSTTGLSGEKHKRKLFLHLSADLNLKKNKSLNLRPLSYLVLQGQYLAVGTGAALEGNYLSISAIALGDNGKNMNLQTGFSFSSGMIRIFYNYRFNLISGNKLMPFSLLHQTGLAFSLNNVDKRKLPKTIILPNL
jgi:type IX secretion system PorP/SprF family membrane protein